MDAQQTNFSSLHRAHLNFHLSNMINSRTEAEALWVISALVMVLPGGVTPHSTCHLLRNRWHHFFRTDFDCRKSCNLRFVASDIGRHSQFVMYLASMTEDGITRSFVEFSRTYSKSRFCIKYVSAFTRSALAISAQAVLKSFSLRKSSYQSLM